MQEHVEPFVISGEGVLTPPGRDRWVTEEMFRQRERRPEFSLQEVAEVFFGMPAGTLRKRLWERPDRWKAGRTDAGHRRFGLHQIEDIAHMLLADGALKPVPFAMVIRHIKASAIQHRYEIGDTGFLLEHWNGAQRQRRRLVTEVMEVLELLDAEREPEGYLDEVRQAAALLWHTERALMLEKR